MLDLSQKTKNESDAEKNFRHFCCDSTHEWQQICDTLLSCERLLHVMSNESTAGSQPLHTRQRRRQTTTADNNDHNHSCSSDIQRIRAILRSIEPKKYSKHKQNNNSLNKLKKLTQILMTSNLKRSTSLQSVAVVVQPNEVTDDDSTTTTTATLPRLRRRPRFARFYHSLDVSDNVCDVDNDDDNDSQQESKAHQTQDETKLSLLLPTTDVTTRLSTETQPQHDLSSNRHSCDVTRLLSSTASMSPSREGPSRELLSSSNRQILKYSKKRLRGPYGEMLESMMSTKTSTADVDKEDVKQSLTFIQELLKETEKQRKQLDESARETTGTSTSSLTTADDTTQKQSLPETTTQSITATIGRHLDTRTHIVGELYDTEKTFCEQLRDLCEKYSKPLTENCFIDAFFVEIIFGKIPGILAIHSKFLEELRHRMTSWTPDETTVGDLFDVFDEKPCFDSYLSFVDNWFECKQLIKQLTRDKPLFAKFLADASREHRQKLSLDELMISVIQRIPRFELLLKQLLKNTSKEHKDFELLSNALRKIHSLVLYINRVKNDMTSSSMSSSDVLVIGGQQPSDITLQQLETLLCDSSLQTIQTLEQKTQQLLFTCFVFMGKRERLLTLFTNNLIIFSLKGKKKSEKFEENKYKFFNSFPLDFLEIKPEISGSGGTGNTDFGTGNTDPKDEIEKDLQILQKSAKELNFDFSRKTIEELMQTLMKTLNDLKNSSKTYDLEVACSFPAETNSILISFQTNEKRIKFFEIFSKLKEKHLKEKQLMRNFPEFLCALPIRKTRAGLQFTCASPTIGTNDVWICNSDGFVGQISVLSLRQTNDTSSTAPVEPTVVSCNGVCNSRIICMTCVPKSQQICEESDVSDSDCCDNQMSDTSTTQTFGSSTMWFGTDDSSVHIYSCFDAIRIKKNKVKVPLSGRVDAIVYFCERVFIALDNNSVAIFDRNPLSGNWETVPLIRENISCFRFCTVGHYLWTTHSNEITIRDSNLEPVFDVITVDDIHTTDDDFISSIVQMNNNLCFISSQNSLTIHLFSAKTPFQHLSSISIASALNTALVTCEDIIRQHKSACLRISALLALNDRLWIGTSAGIICLLDSNSMRIEIVPNGHTGHVRFLTSTEAQNNGKHLVISGGDGIEAYSSSTSTTLSIIGCPQLLSTTSVSARDQQLSDNGREDSTNHLLLWQI